MRYMFGKCQDLKDTQYIATLAQEENEEPVVMPREFADRWKRQMNTPYEDLPESEKKSDLDEADKMLKIMQGAWEVPEESREVIKAFLDGKGLNRIDFPKKAVTFEALKDTEWEKPIIIDQNEPSPLVMNTTVGTASLNDFVRTDRGDLIQLRLLGD